MSEAVAGEGEQPTVEQQAVEQPAAPPVAPVEVTEGDLSEAANILIGSIKGMTQAEQDAIKKKLCVPSAAASTEPKSPGGGGRRSKRRRQKKSSKKSKKGGRSRKNCGSKNRRKLSRRR